jgi:hypothetical protein
MNIAAQRRKREAMELVKQGWTVVPMHELKYQNGVCDWSADRSWLIKQQEQHAWCQQHAKPGEFRFVHPNLWLFKSNASALLFKLSMGGE